jgi:diadenosine tetraphosphatase ApaH/serine/threonine PP2A family protein phosphatase
MERIFALVERFCFQGHTHIPGVFTEGLNFVSPEECDFVYPLVDSKALVNVGSVGQPRNGDARASYVILTDEPAEAAAATDGETANANDGQTADATDGEAATVRVEFRVEFQRVEYDLETTIEKIYAIPDLDNFLGDRLRDGR